MDRVIAGWTEGLQLMREGGKAELVIPQDLAYGPGRPGIPPYQTLVFQVELLKVQ
ncbi:MAG: FKBP-type peptidyl-prolyl cis-trans isomerase [Rhodopseudomonas palustris]|nr:FKBP-type peptidyl-prolyl cis-trans isomerase [Rhodopseudomonas palustris]